MFITRELPGNSAHPRGYVKKTLKLERSCRAAFQLVMAFVVALAALLIAIQARALRWARQDAKSLAAGAIAPLSADTELPKLFNLRGHIRIATNPVGRVFAR
jgi:hypothetical protein